MKLDLDTVVTMITALSLVFVGFQIFQANRLQRNQVEQDYLRRALDVLHSPSLALQDLASAIDDLYRMGQAQKGTPPPYDPAVAAPVASYRDALYRFASTLQDAIVFGEALERVHGTGEYIPVLAALKEVNVKGFALQELFGQVIRGEVRIATLSEEPLFEASVRASEAAANLIAEKIIRMYRLVDVQP